MALILLGVITAFLQRWTRWGNHDLAMDADERAAVLPGVRVSAAKISVSGSSSTIAGLIGILEAGCLGGITTNLGQSMELTVIAATVIGGANPPGISGAIVGAALIEFIRNSLILLGISTFWQGVSSASSSPSPSRQTE